MSVVIIKSMFCERIIFYTFSISLLVFAAMSIGQSSIRLHEMQEQKSMHWPEVFKTVFEISFFIAQTFFILIYHRVSQNAHCIFPNYAEFVVYLSPATGFSADN